MKKTSYIFIMLLFITGCNQKTGNYYFDFDTIEHYSNINIDGFELFNILGEPNLTKNQQLQLDIIIGNKPDSLNEKSFITNLELIGFEKNLLPKIKHRKIKEIFKEKTHENSYLTMCSAVYRDVIIFRKKGKIEGIAKICFDCKKNQILGTKINTADFGESGDYSALQKILNE